MKLRTIFGSLLAIVTGIFCSAADPAAPGWHQVPMTHLHAGKARQYTIHYYLPKHGNPAKMPVLIVMHGAGGGEKGKNPGESWKRLAEEQGFVVIAPAYPVKDYPAAAYQHAGISRTWDKLDLLPKEEWTAMTVEKAFDLVREEAKLEAKDYYLYGMSAGGQFVHRFLLAVPEARVRRAVLASPGTWTFPCLDGKLDDSGNVYGWPVSMRDVPDAEKNLKAALQRDVVVILGTADNKKINPSKNPDHGFMTTPGALAEGAGRCDRGKNAFAAAKRTAEQLNVPFNWKLIVLDDVAHSNFQVIRGDAASIKGLPYRNQCKPNGAFHQLFHDVPQQ